MINVTTEIRDFLLTLEGINTVNIDYMENTGETWGLYQTGQTIYKQYITGDAEFQTVIALYYHTDAATDNERINNIAVMSRVASALNTLNDMVITQGDITGKIIKTTCSNPALFAVPVSLNDGYTYQLQISVIHT